MAPYLQLAKLRDQEKEEEDVRLLDSYDLETRGQQQLSHRIQIRITGMTCAACSDSLESALTSLHSVITASVALLQNKADVLFDPTLLKVAEAIEDAGFEAQVIPDSSTNATKRNHTSVGQFSIGGMTCAACIKSVEAILRALPGVSKAVVALATSLGEVQYDPTLIAKDDIVNAIEDAGFEASLIQSNTQDKIILTIVGVSNELDVRYSEGTISNLKGVRQFCFDRTSGDLELLFDTEVISSRSLVDGIQVDTNS